MTVIKISKDCIQLFLEKCRSKQFVKKICKFIKEVISLIIIFLSLNQVLVQWEISCVKIMFKLWNIRIRNFLNLKITLIINIHIIYWIFISRGLWLLIYYIYRNKEHYLNFIIPILLSIDDLENIIYTVYYALYGINNLIEQQNKIYNNNSSVICIAALYISIPCIKWIYIKNKSDWQDVNKEYTNFYDKNNNRIPLKSFVIYNGRRYYVYSTEDMFGENMIKKEIRINPCGYDGGKSILLENAVRDKEGNLILDDKNIN